MLHIFLPSFTGHLKTAHWRQLAGRRKSRLELVDKSTWEIQSLIIQSTNQPLISWLIFFLDYSMSISLWPGFFRLSPIWSVMSVSVVLGVWALTTVCQIEGKFNIHFHLAYFLFTCLLFISCRMTWAKLWGMKLLSVFWIHKNWWTKSLCSEVNYSTIDMYLFSRTPESTHSFFS